MDILNIFEINCISTYFCGMYHISCDLDVLMVVKIYSYVKTLYEREKLMPKLKLFGKHISLMS